jgi:Glutaredoxin-like domain (DUF836)
VTVYSREGCGLCEELLEHLGPWAAAREAVLEVIDVDEDPVLARRYGLRVPVLEVDGEPLGHGRIDLTVLARYV